jgi:glucokinase
MYLGIDIGGTKTVIACLDENGVIQESYRFPTPESYKEFLKELSVNVDKLSTKRLKAACVAFPAKIDRERGVAIAFGNRPWRNIHVREDMAKLLGCKVLIENDANLAGLSEAMLLKQYRKVLYVTISTGIGTGFIVDQQIDPDMADSEGGNILLQHGGKLEPWEDFASGRAIVNRFGKRASEINDKRTWQIIAHDIALGLIDLIAVMQPDAVVLGGGVGTYYSKYKEYLNDYIKDFENPLFTAPAIREAARPELAVVYGCYDLAKGTYGKAS